MWTYVQKSGVLLHDGLSIAHGYSGHGDGKNNPAMEHVKGIGPIPVGSWQIVGPPVKTDQHGPYVLRLQPAPGNDPQGRGGFLIHGDSVEHPGQASLGCIILPRLIRERIWNSGDHSLLVVSGSTQPNQAA